MKEVNETQGYDMEKLNSQPYKLAVEQLRQVQQFEYWARMDLIADRLLGPELDSEMASTLVVTDEVLEQTVEAREQWLHQWAVGQYSRMTKEFDYSGDELGWKNNRQRASANYKRGLIELNLLTSKDFERFNESYDQDHLFRARYESRTSDAMRWLPDAKE